jgi:hypothetical protein
MSKEMSPTVHASGEKRKLRDRLSPENKSHAATGYVWFNHGQSLIGTGAAIGLAATGALLPAAVAAAFVGVNEFFEVPLAQRYRNNRRAEIGKPPKKQRKLLGMIDIGKKGSHAAHQVHSSESLPERRTSHHKVNQSAEQTSTPLKPRYFPSARNIFSRR